MTCEESIDRFSKVPSLCLRSVISYFVQEEQSVLQLLICTLVTVL